MVSPPKEEVVEVQKEKEPEPSRELMVMPEEPTADDEDSLEMVFRMPHSG